MSTPTDPGLIDVPAVFRAAAAALTAGDADVATRLLLGPEDSTDIAVAVRLSLIAHEGGRITGLQPPPYADPEVLLAWVTEQARAWASMTPV